MFLKTLGDFLFTMNYKILCLKLCFLFEKFVFRKLIFKKIKNK